MHKRILSFISSLRLTVACLVCAMVLVFAGTLAQVHLGLYEAQKVYFQSAFVFWSPKGADWKVPVWPGGYLLGWVLMINLVAAHATRFQFSRKKVGIFLTHVGLIILLLGQFFTELFQVESNMRLEEGQTKNYSDDARKPELAIIDVTNPEFDEVIAIPADVLEETREFRHPKLPFTVRVKEWYKNSDPRLVAPVMDPGIPRGTHGVGTRMTFTPVPVTKKMDEINFPAAQIEIVGDGGVESTWMVSNWLDIPGAVNLIQRQFGAMLGDALSKPQEFSYAGRTYRVALRSTRYYKPYSIHLIEFRHDRYIGTSIPKNFSSLVKLRNPSVGPVQEEREILIYMNQPLRYGGETYYQGSFEPGDTVSILQVVRNPVWLTPYISCTIVGIGLTVQFMMHLVGFLRRPAKGKAPPPETPSGTRNTPRKQKGPVVEPEDEDAIAAGVRRTAERRSV